MIFQAKTLICFHIVPWECLGRSVTRSQKRCLLCTSKGWIQDSGALITKDTYSQLLYKSNRAAGLEGPLVNERWTSQ